MIVVCSNCVAEDRPGFVTEKPPYRDDRVSHRICGEHVEMYRARLARTQPEAPDAPDDEAHGDEAGEP